MYLRRTVSTDKILHFKNTLLLLLVICNVEVTVNSNYIHDGFQLGNMRLKINTLSLLLVIDNIEGRMNSNYIHDGVHHGNPRLKVWSDSVLTMLQP